MKKIATILICLCMYAATQAQQKIKTPKLSAPTRHYLSAWHKLGGGSAMVPGYVYKHIGGSYYISGMIKVAEGTPDAALDAISVLVGTRAGNIWTTQVPVDKMDAFTQAAGIECIELDLPLLPAMDSARKVTRADSAQRGIYLPMPLTGKDVVTGIIDAGFDFKHPSLYDTTHSHYRVKRVWCQKSSGTPPSGFSYGSEIADTDAIRAKGTDTSITSHGAHVAGIVGGSGYGGSADNRRFRGMAYESDLVLVGIMPAAGQWIQTGVSDVVDGMSYTYNYATSVGKPCVVNLSWGSSLGPHDGSSLFSQACDALTGPGKIFVCSGGNNGDDSIHLQKTFTATDTIVSTFVTFSPYLDSNNQKTYVDIWGDTGNTFCLNVKLYDTTAIVAATGNICLTADSTYTYNLIGSNGDTCYVTVTTVPVEYNSKPHAYVFLHSKAPNKICLATTATSGVVDMWEGYVDPPTGYYGALKKLGYPFAVSGDNAMTTSDISSSRSAISVGAYVSKANFTNISGSNLGYTGALRGRIAGFSSKGPTADGRTKPDITGPGLGLVSAVSSYDADFDATGASYQVVISAWTDAGRTYRYAILGGTSMSSPAVSGIVAMMLQLNPTLTPDSAKTIIRLNAITDVYTGVLPAAGTNVWGHGKINAYKSLRYMVGNLSVASSNMDIMDCVLYPNPNKGMFSLNYTAQQAEQVNVSITDITGKLVKAYNWQAKAGSNTYSINATDLAPGIYLTKVWTVTGYNTIKMIVE